MGQIAVLAGATKGGISATASALVGIALVAGIVAAAAALIWKAATSAEARSRQDRAGRLRALDELTAVGSMRPEDYRELQAALLREV